MSVRSSHELAQTLNHKGDLEVLYVFPLFRNTEASHPNTIDHAENNEYMTGAQKSNRNSDAYEMPTL